jgi:hypothetical protein
MLQPLSPDDPGKFLDTFDDGLPRYRVGQLGFDKPNR